MKFVLFTFVVILFSCGYKVIPLKNSYFSGNFIDSVQATKEEVWDKAVDLFAQQGLSIHIIDKESGLITSNAGNIPWSFEKQNGILVDTNAFVVIPRIVPKGGDFKQAVNRYSYLTAEWNIRIKSRGAWTIVNINLVNVNGHELGRTVRLTPLVEYRSTEVFERLIFNHLQ